MDPCHLLCLDVVLLRHAGASREYPVRKRLPHPELVVHTSLRVRDWECDHAVLAQRASLSTILHEACVVSPRVSCSNDRQALGVVAARSS